ncbi:MULTISPECIES: flagellar motor stator protein MotA [Alcaligenes]|uniref:flagellar motor stator protein MotA n=1 Tax=Alcaligenes TaxID=507 RepID=UPI000D52DF17|nr:MULTISPECIES: flagellar motor stator protein MotA [Alcaligenes]AWG33919.1 flagellar motor stator protein MotA [Alcaligenes aquatilis]QXR37094.1 flagellar motor stator protein MotA [Alcaligenes aquatilis]UYY88425.1 flagellar motor stator protein MotA [Alcaligenes sp. SMD-FA]HBQ91239.1 flagellar motor stator protein MotA [Alcaligenes faecalis]
MLIILGYIIVFVSVFGSFVGLGGHLGALYQPFELLLIGGAALGAYFASNSGKSIKLLARALPTAFRSSPYNKQLYMQLMGMLSVLLNKARRDGMMSIEADIENPQQSPIFSDYPNVVKDPVLMNFVSDYLRLMISGNMSSFEIETLMDQDIETHEHELNVPARALREVADALPAFGIVAAVLGVVKALASVDQPPAVLADLISKAMVGTFLGILMAYGFVAPLAATIERRTSDSVKVLECIKVTLLANLNGYPPQLAVEFGRKVLFSSDRPSFQELEEHVRQARSGAGRKA